VNTPCQNPEAFPPGSDPRIERAEIRTEQAEARTEQAEARTENAETRTEQAVTRTEHAEARTERAETRTEQAKTRTEQAETRMEQAQARSEEAETRSDAVVRASELRYRQLNAELEQRVLERTVQLQNANEELQAFSYSVSHDLRAPLRHVQGFVAQLQKDAGPALSEEHRDLLAMISQSANRMKNMINDLLTFARIGQAEMQRADVHLDQLVAEILLEFRANQGREITWDIRPLPVVRADPALLRLVLVNLISNAVKFTGARAQARIEIGCAPPRDGETVIFVRDNGAGFDPLQAKKLFGVFQRLHPATEFEGTGIGLANVRRIIHRHGGRTWAEGAVDGGATFYFSVPLAPAAGDGQKAVSH
jgi:light-regulated signal transduction histidine kinase (bacteriophytochrome)